MYWRLSGGEKADFYLINIATNDPQTPYGGQLNITTANITQQELSGFQTGYEYNITIRGVNCGSQMGSESKPLKITPQGMTCICLTLQYLHEELLLFISCWLQSESAA